MGRGRGGEVVGEAEGQKSQKSVMNKTKGGNMRRVKANAATTVFARVACALNHLSDVRVVVVVGGGLFCFLCVCALKGAAMM